MVENYNPSLKKYFTVDIRSIVLHGTECEAIRSQQEIKPNVANVKMLQCIMVAQVMIMNVY